MDMDVCELLRRMLGVDSVNRHISGRERAEAAMVDLLEREAADLLVRPLGHLLGQNVARVAFKRSAYLRNFVYKFAELLSDRLSRDLIIKAMEGHVNDYEL